MIKTNYKELKRCIQKEAKTKHTQMKNAFGCVLNDDEETAKAHLAKLSDDDLQEIAYYATLLNRLAIEVFFYGQS